MWRAFVFITLISIAVGLLATKTVYAVAGILAILAFTYIFDGLYSLLKGGKQ